MGTEILTIPRELTNPSKLTVSEDGWGISHERSTEIRRDLNDSLMKYMATSDDPTWGTFYREIMKPKYESNEREYMAFLLGELRNRVIS